MFTTPPAVAEAPRRKAPGALVVAGTCVIHACTGKAEKPARSSTPPRLKPETWLALPAMRMVWFVIVAGEAAAATVVGTLSSTPTVPSVLER
jgi:hypothetical protein